MAHAVSVFFASIVGGSLLGLALAYGALWVFAWRQRRRWTKNAETVGDFTALRAREIAAEIEVGRQRFGSMVQTWAQNFGVEGAPQPDRAGALMALSQGHYSREWAIYVRSRGGLAGATLDCLLAMGYPPETSPMLAKRMALTMVQVGTVCGLPFDKLIERSLLVRPEDLEAAPIIAGPLDDTVDVDADRDWGVVNRSSHD